MQPITETKANQTSSPFNPQVNPYSPNQFATFTQPSPSSTSQLSLGQDVDLSSNLFNPYRSKNLISRKSQIYTLRLSRFKPYSLDRKPTHQIFRTYPCLISNTSNPFKQPHISGQLFSSSLYIPKFSAKTLPSISSRKATL